MKDTFGMSDPLHLHIMITTYNRPEMLARLIRQIEDQYERESMDNLRITVAIYDDDSDKVPYYGLPSWATITPCKPHRGKERYWQLFNLAWFDARATEANLFLQIPDDVELVPRFFRRLLWQWFRIEDDDKIALNPLLIPALEGVRQWTAHEPVREIHNGTAFWNMGWIDCAFLCERRMLDALSWQLSEIGSQRWQRDPLLGSGVGTQMSIRLWQQVLNMYGVTESLLLHGDHPSLMNAKARERDPLTTLYVQDKATAVPDEVFDAIDKVTGKH